MQQANQARRQRVPLSHLTVGLQCGGSDGYSGISANPVLGAAVDLLVHAHSLEREAVEAWLAAQPPVAAETHADLESDFEAARQKVLHPPPTALSRPGTALGLSRPVTALKPSASTAGCQAAPEGTGEVNVLTLE